MKHFIRKTLCIASAFMLFCAGCRNSEVVIDNDTDDVQDKPAQVFDTEGIAYSGFDIGEDGLIYAAVSKESGRSTTIENLNGTSEEIPISETALYLFDDKGNNQQSYVFDEQCSPTNLCSCGDSVYYIALEGYCPTLKKYNLGESSCETVYAFYDESSIEKMERIGDKLYILALNSDNMGRNENTDDDYHNSGEEILTFDLNDMSVDIIMDECALNFSKTENNTLMIYAHDDEGYYFTEFLPESDSFSDKTYTDIGMINCFAICPNDRYIYISLSGSTLGFTMSQFGESGNINILDNTSTWNTVKVNGSMIYFVDFSTDSDSRGKLVAYDISDALSRDLSNKIKIISAEYIAEMPSSMGFGTEATQVSYDSFALTVLSQDKNYDLCILNSREDFSANIRDKGSFYPLNDVEGVEEYLDACFPFIKDAAVNADGDIWMLPVNVKINALVYNENICSEHGIDFSSVSNAEDFIDEIISAYNDGDLAYDAGAAYYAEQLLSDYIMTYGTFDTDEFRDLAGIIKDKIFGNEEAFTVSPKMLLISSAADYSEYAFGISYSESVNALVSSNAGMCAVNVPLFTDSSRSIATCTFICVNPYSYNLDQTLEYVSSLAKAYLNNEKNILLADSPIYSSNDYYRQLKDIHSNGTVRFTFSNELYLIDFYEYVNGAITLEEFISEADRKLSAYMNE